MADVDTHADDLNVAEHEIHLKVEFSESHPSGETISNISSGDTLPTIMHIIHGFIAKGGNGITDIGIESKTVNITSSSAFEMNTINNSVAVSVAMPTTVTNATYIPINVLIKSVNNDVYTRSVYLNNNTSLRYAFDCNGAVAANAVLATSEIKYLYFKQ